MSATRPLPPHAFRQSWWMANIDAASELGSPQVRAMSHEKPLGCSMHASPRRTGPPRVAQPSPRSGNMSASPASILAAFSSVSSTCSSERPARGYLSNAQMPAGVAFRM